MGKLALKFYKLQPFSDRFIVHSIRRLVWDLRDKLMQDKVLRKNLKNDLDHAIVELQHLRMVQPSRKEEYHAAIEKIHKIEKPLKEEYKEINSVIKKEIKDFEKIDYRGQRMAFRELKDVKKFEQNLVKNLEVLQKKDMKKATTPEAVQAVIAKYDTARKAVWQGMNNLDQSFQKMLKALWDMVRRQAIEGIETEVILDTESEEKLLRLEKVQAKKALDLVKEQKGYMKKLSKPKSMEDLLSNANELFKKYLEEMEALHLMMKKHRILVFDIKAKFKEIERIAEQAELGKGMTQENLKVLDETLAKLETLYSWLYKEERRFQTIKYPESTHYLKAV